MTANPQDFAIRIEEKPPHGRAAVIDFAEWRPEYLTEMGTAIRGWEMENITRIDLPKPLAYLEGLTVKKIAVHRKAADELRRALRAINEAGLWDFLSPYGGGYVFRPKRDSNELSLHSFGLAVDFDPVGNPFKGDPNESRFGRSGEGRAVVRLFELYGWYWGGRFERPDAMHFQFATGY